MSRAEDFPMDEVLGHIESLDLDVQTRAEGPRGALPLSGEILRTWPSGDLFGLTQNAGMGWDPRELLGPQYLILCVQGGMRAEDGSPIALGYHTGHWEVGSLVRAAASEFRSAGGVPFAAYCSDPCDGRTQGTPGMYDSLPYRNDAAIVMRRLIRSLPTRQGVLAVATCDKGLPATMIALAGVPDLPSVLVPGGVTLPASHGEDAGKIQSIGARFSHGEITLEDAATAGCRACATPGGGCQFLGTAATSQVVAEALGISLPHSALSPSGQPIWLETANRSVKALWNLTRRGIRGRDILTREAVHNAMVIHAAFGGSTNLLLHLPAIAFAAGLQRPTVAEWSEINRKIPRFVDVLPNGPRSHPTVQVFLAGGVPEVMLHLRKLGMLHLDVLTVTGQTLRENLDWWEKSDRRQHLRSVLENKDGIDPNDVILSPGEAVKRGMTSTVCFPLGNLCPEGAVIKATSIDPAVIDPDNVYRKTGPARVFATERDAIQAVKGRTDRPIQAGDVMVLFGRGPLGSGMEETYQITSALKYLPHGREVALLTDARFSGVSTGACIGHMGPEALAGGPIGKVRDGDIIRIVIDRNTLDGSVDLVGPVELSDSETSQISPREAAKILDQRSTHEGLSPDSLLPDDTRLWAALQRVGGGVWGGCVYDVDRIIETLNAGEQALRKNSSAS